MSRIYKGTETTLKLLISKTIGKSEVSDLNITLFTDDPHNVVEITDGYTIEGNVVVLKTNNYVFDGMNDGVINYKIEGIVNGESFTTQRQSNYFLKTPSAYSAISELNTIITENGVHIYKPEDVDSWNRVVITVDVPQQGGTCNLGEGEIYLTVNDAGFYELYAAEDGYDGWSKFYVTLENGGAIKIHKAEELIQWFNDGGDIDFGAYHYVGGEITDIQEISTQYGNATYVLDNGFKVYRGKWIDGNPFDEDQIKVGAYIVVYGIIQEHNGVLGFKVNSQVIAYQECEGGEVVSCFLEEKGIRPSMGERDDNGYIVVEESEGFDGLSRVVIDPTTIYNEGVSAGKAEGGDLIIGTGDIYLTPNERGQRFEILPSEWEYDAFDKFIVELENFDLGGDANIYDALSVHQLLMDGVISYGNVYLFKGEITEIQRIRPEYGDARYTLDGSLNVYNGQTMGYDLQVGDNVIVIGTLSEYNGAPQFSAGSMIKVWWREGGSGNCDDGFIQAFNTLNSSELTAYTDLLYENSAISDAASSNLETDCSNGETVLDFGKYFVAYNNTGKQWYLSKTDISNSFTELKTSYYIDSLISIRGINCYEIKTVDAQTFKNIPQLRFIGGLLDLGISFINEQVIDLSACEKLYCDDNIGITSEFIDSLYDFTKGDNRFGVTTSEIIFNDIDDSIKYSLEAKGWKITVK